MADDTLAALHRVTHHTVLEGLGHTDAALRQQVASGSAPAELAPLIDKIRNHAYRVTDADIDSLRARYTEDQLFEIIVAAALGAAEYRLARALAAVEQS